MTSPIGSLDPFDSLRNPFSQAFRDELNAMHSALSQLRGMREELEQKIEMAAAHQTLYGAIHSARITGWSGVTNVAYDAQATGLSSIQVTEADNELRNLIKLSDDPAVNAVVWYPPATPDTAIGWLIYHSPSDSWKLFVLESFRLKVGCDEA